MDDRQAIQRDRDLDAQRLEEPVERQTRQGDPSRHLEAHAPHPGGAADETVDVVHADVVPEGGIAAGAVVGLQDAGVEAREVARIHDAPAARHDDGQEAARDVPGHLGGFAEVRVVRPPHGAGVGDDHRPAARLQFPGDGVGLALGAGVGVHHVAELVVDLDDLPAPGGVDERNDARDVDGGIAARRDPRLEHGARAGHVGAEHGRALLAVGAHRIDARRVQDGAAAAHRLGDRGGISHVAFRGLDLLGLAPQRLERGPDAVARAHEEANPVARGEERALWTAGQPPLRPTVWAGPMGSRRGAPQGAAFGRRPSVAGTPLRTR